MKDGSRTPATRTLLIRADASARIGVGHLMRCLALAHGARAHGVRTIFVASELPEVFERRVLAEGHELRRIEAMPGGEDDAVQTLGAAAEANATDAVIDLYECRTEYLERLSAWGFTTLCIDDNAGLERFPVDAVLNLNGHAAASQYRSKCAPGTRLLLGPRYALLRQEFLAFRDWERPRADDPRSILISLGGGNQIPAFIAIIERLAGALRPFELSFVLARPDFETAALEAAAEEYGLSYRLVIAPSNMAAELAGHDTLISSGGSTVWEALYMGIPAVLVAIVENQMNSCRALREMIPHPVFTSISEISPAAFTKVARDASLRGDLTRAGRAVVDGRGAERVIGELFGHGSL